MFDVLIDDNLPLKFSYFLEYADSHYMD